MFDFQTWISCPHFNAGLFYTHFWVPVLSGSWEPTSLTSNNHQNWAGVAPSREDMCSACHTAHSTLSPPSTEAWVGLFQKACLVVFHTPVYFAQCGRLDNGSPQNVHALIPRTYECVTISGKREFADVIKSLKLESLFWIIQRGPM